MRLLTLLLAAALACGACTKSRTVRLFNNTPVDLAVHLDDKVTNIAPGESAKVILRGTQWIDFGMIGHRYEFGAVNPGSPTYSPLNETLYIQAESNGQLYIVPADGGFPVMPLPQQQPGFPVAPAHRADLT